MPRLSAFGDLDEPDDSEPLSDDELDRMADEAIAIWDRLCDEAEAERRERWLEAIVENGREVARTSHGARIDDNAEPF